MKTIKGPAIFLAQFAGDQAPFDTLGNIATWARDLGYKGVQIPTWDARLFDLEKAAESRRLLRRIKETLAGAGVEVTELSTHLQGSWSRCTRRTTTPFDGFAPPHVHGNPKARQTGRVEQVTLAAGHPAARAHRLGRLLRRARLAFVYPWPQRPAGLIDEAFAELAGAGRRSSNAYEDAGVDALLRDPSGRGPARRRRPSRCSWSRSATTIAAPTLRPQPLPAAAARLSRLHRHLPRADPGVPRQGRRVPPEGRRASTAATSPGSERAGRFRSLGDGQVDFAAIFSQARPQHDFDGWAVLEWECCAQEPRGGRARGRAVHRAPHHPSDRSRLRRLRRRLARTGPQPPPARAGVRRRVMAIEGKGGGKIRGGCAWAWWAAARARSSARCTGSRRASTTATSSWRARSPRTRSAPGGPPRSSDRAGAGLWQLRGDGEEGGGARRPDRCGRDRHAEPHARSRSPRRSSRPASTSSATSR